MSESDVRRHQSALQQLRPKIAKETKTVATKRKQAAAARSAASKSKSPSTVSSKLREAERKEKEANEAESRRAKLEKDVADREKSLYQAEEKVEKERARAQTRSLKQMENRIRIDQAQFSSPSTPALVPHGEPSTASARAVGADAKEYDLFLSHASEDKDEIARALAEALVARGARVWYDDFELTVGQSLRRRIDEGLARSKFGVVILSPAFFAKDWPQRELDGLVAKEVSGGGTVVLPIWHHVSKDEVLAYSPPLADKVALNTGVTIVDDIADELMKVVAAS